MRAMFGMQRASVLARTLLLGLLVSLQCAPQNITGTILGSVTDSTGAVIPAAKVVITNTDTGQSNETATDTVGRYEVPLLKPGRYSVSVSATGFQTLERQGIRLTVGDRLRVDLTLQVGQIAERVTVNERAELVESGTGSLSVTLGGRSIEDLPLKGRYVLQYAALTPGVQINPFAVNAGGGGLTNADFSVNGGRYRSNELLVDGVSSSQPKNNDFGVLPLPEGVVEMKIHTNSFSAEFGRTGGGVFNIITRGGTNQFHGSVFHFHQNDNLNANAWFANSRGQAKGNFRRNLFGGSAGGPVARNKTFFYADYQGARNSSAGSTGAATLPTRQQMSGDFSQTLNRTGQPVLIYDPVTTRQAGAGRIRDAFPGNRIPASHIDRAAANVIKLYPQPNRPGIGPANLNNFVFQIPAKSRGRQYTARIDHELASHHRLFGRYTTSKGSSKGFGEYGTVGDTQLGFNPGSPEYNASLNDTYTFSPTLLLNTRLGFTRGASARRPLHENVSLAELGFPAFLDRDKEDSSLPGFRPANYAGLGPQAGDRIRLANDIWHLASDVTSIRGGHSLKWGGEVRMYNQNLYQAQAPSGQFSFAVGTTQGPDPQRATLMAGDGFASFLLGVGSGSISSSPRLAVRNFYWALFFNDHIRVTRSFTLSLGLRYEVEEPRTERYNRFATFDFDGAFPIRVPGMSLTGFLTHPGVDGQPRNQTDRAVKNFGPRAGFAWTVLPKLAVRGGYGIFYSPVIGSTAANTLGVTGALITTPWVSTIDGFIPLNYLSNPLPDGALRTSKDPVDVYQMGQSVLMADRNNRNNISTQQWNLNLQRELPGELLVEVGYAGNKGTRLPMVQEFNQLDPRHQSLGPALADRLPNPFFGTVREGGLAQATIARSQLLRPFPQYQNIQTYLQNRGSSIYHSMTLRVEKRLSRGLMAQTSFTGGKLIDNASGRVVNITDFVPPVQNHYNLRGERSISEGDISRRLVMFGEWDVPVGRGRRFGASAPGVVDQIVGGWSLAAWATFHTGFPLHLRSTGNSGVSGSGVLRPNSTGRSAEKTGAVQSRLTEYFDTGAFRVPDPFTFGNVTRTLPDVRGPRRGAVDLTIHKDFHIRERLMLRARGEFYNISNTPFFGMPGDTLGSQAFGLISSATLERTAQLSMKLIW